MMRIRLLVLILVLSQAVSAQSGLIIQGTSPNLHLLHTVVAKENWYSIGRIYNMSPKELAPYNKTSLEKPLSIGQLLKIPLTAANFSQNGVKQADESLIPLYHIVQEKEGMYRVSVTYNKVPADNLKKWNNLNTDQLKNGMKLVVGYLKVKGDQSPFASAGSNKITVGSSTASTESATQAPSSRTAEPAAKKEEVVANKPVSTTPAATTATPPATTTTPPATTPSNGTLEKNEPTAIKEEPAARPEAINTSSPADYKGGYFKKQFNETGKSTTGNAGIFKSTSGWNDGKYYALMNNVPIGTIVKISFSSTNKSIYAKVLGQLPEMKESVGLSVRLSDAAASELGVSLSKFYVDVKY